MMRKIILAALCIMQICICQAQEKQEKQEKAKKPVKVDMAVVCDSLKARLDSLTYLAERQDSIIQYYRSNPETVVVYGNDSLTIAQQEETIRQLRSSASSKDSLIINLVQTLHSVDTFLVKQAYGCCFQKYDRAKVQGAEEMIKRVCLKLLSYF